MQDRSLTRLGGICSILLGVITATAAVTYLLMPGDLRAAVPGAQILPAIARDFTPLGLELWQLAATGVLGLAVVPALASLVHQENEGWMRWAANVGYLGFAVTAVSNALSAGRLPGLATAFMAGDDSTKSALAAVWRSTLDFQGFWQFWAVGFFITVACILSLRGNVLPRNLLFAGLAAAVLYWLAPIGVLLRNQTFILVVVGLAAILTPIWYVWLGLVMNRRTT